MAGTGVTYQKPVVNEKVCTRCKTLKLLSEFPLKGGVRLGHQSWCTACTKLGQKRHYKNNRGDYLDRARQRYADKRHDLRFNLHRLLKGRLTSGGDLYNNITLDYLLRLYDAQNGVCSLTGRTFSIGESEDGLPARDAISLDKIDRTRGYVEGNVRLVIYQVNVAKHRFDDVDLLDICSAVVKHFHSIPDEWGTVPEIDTTVALSVAVIEDLL